jgi:hypothetical protein
MVTAWEYFAVRYGIDLSVARAFRPGPRPEERRPHREMVFDDEEPQPVGAS